MSPLIFPSSFSPNFLPTCSEVLVVARTDIRSIPGKISGVKIKKGIGGRREHFPEARQLTG
jgi:hypothetical protein